jgi:hypothetical protein
MVNFPLRAVGESERMLRLPISAPAFLPVPGTVLLGFHHHGGLEALGDGRRRFPVVVGPSLGRPALKLIFNGPP